MWRIELVVNMKLIYRILEGKCGRNYAGIVDVSEIERVSAAN